MEKILTIAMPFYNGSEEDTIRCLDSVYNQDIDFNDFEFIVVDNGSSNPTFCIELIKKYESERKINNISIVRIEDNRCPGGARNAGIKNAKGKYIQYVDNDDYFEKGALVKLIDILKKDPTIDIYMMDVIYLNIDNGEKRGPFHSKNKTDIIPGSQFLIERQIPWVPWQYCYRTEFLLQNNLQFVENVMFEDVDFVMKATMCAKSMCYHPIIKTIHTISTVQTTHVGSNYNKIRDLIRMFYRVRLVGESYIPVNSKCGKEIIGHHQFAYNSFIKRFFWRLKISEFLELMNEYPAATPSKFKLLNFVDKNRKLFIYTCTYLRPLLFGIRKILIWSIRKK